MSRTLKQSPRDKEYWSARPAKGSQQPGKATKKFTHHRERREADRCIKNECVYPGHCNCEGCIQDRREA